MRRATWGVSVAVGLVGLVVTSVGHAAATYDDESAGMRALYTTGAVIANVVPITSAFVADKCLPGYIVCKLSFAGASVVLAAGQLVLSGGADLPQTKAILRRGFSGDWYLTGRHVAGAAKPEPYPEVPPPATTASGFTPPPL